jgi:GTP-binding protein
MHVLDARFVGAFLDASACPAARPAIAFTGRSNVGKSSLVNRFANRAIARTSKTPGRTRQLVYFELEMEKTPPFYLVDLPGYGYAAGPQAERRTFAQAARDLLADPARRAAVFQLVDVSVPWQDSDLEMLAWLLEDELPFALTFTKIDRVNRSAPTKKLAELRKLLPWREDLEVIATSSKDNVGTIGMRKWASRVLRELQSPSAGRATNE